MTKGERRVQQARAVADRLEAAGDHKAAEDIRALCRSYALLRATASGLHRELEETRRAAGMPTWERQKPDVRPALRERIKTEPWDGEQF